MKSHDWIFLMFTTIICCTTIITIAQAQQRGRVKFGVSMQKDDLDDNSSPEIVNQANPARGSASHRASSRFRSAIPSAIPSMIEENKESLRTAQRGSRGRANDRSSRKLTAEATEAVPLVRSRKRLNPAVAISDQPTKIELPTSSIDRTNVIRRSKMRSESIAASTTTSSPPDASASIRRRSDVPSDGPPTESIRKVRTFTSRSVTKQADEVISSENPMTVATTSSNWRNVAAKRGASKVKSSERKSKALVEDQLEDENYPEHFKLLLRKQQPSPALLPKNYPKIPIQEDQTYSKLNEIYEAPRVQGRSRRLEQTSQETSDEILQVSRAIPKVRRVELKREDTARAALKTRRIEPRPEANIESELKIEDPISKSGRSDSEKLRAQVKINKAAIKSRRKEPLSEVKREDILKVPSKPNRRTESSTQDNSPEVKPNEIEESTKASKPLFLPRRAEPYRPKPKTTTQRPTTTSKPIKKPEVLAARSKFKNRLNSRLQFPSLRTKTSSTSDEVIKYDNEVVNTSPAPQPVRPLQITKSRNLALDRPIVEARPKPKQHKFSSRYRGDAFSRYQQKTEPSKPIYTPTIPALTTEPIPRQQLDQVTPYNLENHDLNKSGSDFNFEGIVYDGTAGVWNMVEPVAGGLTRSEISVDSGSEVQPQPQSSVTVSIFEALADILSKTPSTTTSTTTTTTSTTTTSTTELPDIIQENAVLLDLLKRKYIKSDLPSRSSNVVSLTTVRNVVEENSMQANKEEDVSENTLFDSSEEKKKDSLDDFLLSKGSVVPSRNNNNDDENVISKQFDTSYANVGIGSIFAGNKEPKEVDRKTTPTIYVVTPAFVMTTTEIPTTTSSTTTSTTTPSTTTPSSTTTSTTPSTTTTTTTTQSTTTSTTTTPVATTTTTTTPIPTALEITTTSKPTIVFQAPSTTSSTIDNSQGSRQTNTDLIGTNTELEKNIKLLEQLLKLQASLKPKPSSSSTTTSSTPSSTTTTTKATEAPTKKLSAANADDEQFINQLRQLLLIQQQATKKPTTSSTTTPKPITTTTTTTTTRKPITISPQNLQDLLNSFSTPSFTTTTARPVTNLNDIDFLNSLREIGKIQVTTSAPTTFANRIIELALKNRPVKPTSPVYISTTVPPFVPMPQVNFPQILPANEVEKHNQDQASLSADLSLLSTLLGRRITIADLPQITQQFGGNRGRPAPVPAPAPVPRKTTTTTTTPRTTRTTTTTQRPMTRDEIAEIEKNMNLLSSLLGRPVSINELPLIMQELRAGRKPKGSASSGATINFISPAPFKTTTTVRPRPNLSVPSHTPISQEEVIELLKDPSVGSPEQLNIYGQSNDAILAAVLKQRGIGPAHNNLPINDLFSQEQPQKPYRPTRPPPPPPPQRRPVLDGLAWLWKTWQETASPGNRISKSNRQPTASASTRLESPLIVGAFGGDAPAPTANSNDGGEYADLQYPQNPSFGQGNGLLTAAFGVTRAVSQFLGAAFQGAAKSVQSAFSPQAIQQPSLISLSG